MIAVTARRLRPHAPPAVLGPRSARRPRPHAPPAVLGGRRLGCTASPVAPAAAPRRGRRGAQNERCHRAVPVLVPTLHPPSSAGGGLTAPHHPSPRRQPRAEDGAGRGMNAVTARRHRPHAPPAVPVPRSARRPVPVPTLHPPSSAGGGLVAPVHPSARRQTPRRGRRGAQNERCHRPPSPSPRSARRHRPHASPAVLGGRRLGLHRFTRGSGGRPRAEDGAGRRMNAVTARRHRPHASPAVPGRRRLGLHQFTRRPGGTPRAEDGAGRRMNTVTARRLRPHAPPAVLGGRKLMLRSCGRRHGKKPEPAQAGPEKNAPLSEGSAIR